MDPTFDSVRSKYLAQPIAEVDAKGRPLWSMFDRSFGWLTPTILYGFSVVVFGTIVAFFVDRLFVSTWLDVGPGCGASIANCLPVSAQMLLLGLRETSPNFAADLAYAHNTAVMLGFAFAGAYLWCVLYLIRRVNNYDLTPYSFLLCGMRILLALAIALTIRHTIFTNASLSAEVRRGDRLRHLSRGAGRLPARLLSGRRPRLDRAARPGIHRQAPASGHRGACATPCRWT